MRISKLPAAAIDRLVAVDQHAQALAQRAWVAESNVSEARDVINNKTKADARTIARVHAGFNATLKASQEARTRADAAQKVASACKAYVDMLSADAEVELAAAPQANGLDLAGVCTKTVELRAEIAKVRNLPPPSDRALLEGFIDELRRPAEAQIKQMISRWPHFVSGESLRMGMDRDALATLMTVMAPREAMVTDLCERIDAVADAAMPPAQRPARIAELEAQLAQLQAIEVMLVNKRIEDGATDTTYDAAVVLPAVVLGINVVERETRPVS